MHLSLRSFAVIALAFSFPYSIFSDKPSKIIPPFVQPQDNIASPQKSETNTLNETAPITTPKQTIRVVFSPLYRTVLSNEVTSTIEEIYKRMGESFVEGDELIKLDDTIYRGNVLKAEGNLKKANAAYNSKKTLYDDGIASLIELETAAADVATAESNLITAQYELDACTVLAPYDGKVVSLFIEEHETVQQGKPLIEIVDDHILLGKIFLPATYWNKIKLDQEIAITVNETESIVVGKVFRIDAVIDPASALIKVDISVDNSEQNLRAGMIGNLNL